MTAVPSSGVTWRRDADSVGDRSCGIFAARQKKKAILGSGSIGMTVRLPRHRPSLYSEALVGEHANDDDLLQKGRPFIMRFRQPSSDIKCPVLTGKLSAGISLEAK